MKVWLQQGQELWLLIHVEVQARAEVNFAERMLVYHLQIFDRFHSHATSLAILCDGCPKRPYCSSDRNGRCGRSLQSIKILCFSTL